MFIKRVIHSMRNRLITVVQLAMPLAFTILGCAILELFPGPRDPPSMTISMKEYMDRSSQYVALSTSELPPRNPDNLIYSLVDSYYQTYSSDVTEMDYVNENSPTTWFWMDNHLMSIGTRDIDGYNKEHMVAASFSKSTLSEWTFVEGWFNNEAYHTSVLSLSMATNAIMQHLTDGYLTTETTNHPLPRLSATIVADNAGTDMVIAFIGIPKCSMTLKRKSFNCFLASTTNTVLQWCTHK